MKASTGLRNDMLDTGSLKSVLDDGVMRIYAGTVPATADAAIGGATLLCEITDNDQGLGAGQGIDFEAAAVDGVLSKETTQIWSGTNAATGTASFFRIETQADDGSSSTSLQRIQGTVATSGADLNLASTSLVSAALQTIDYFSVAMPTL
jgi:hypothetical protein